MGQKPYFSADGRFLGSTESTKCPHPPDQRIGAGGCSDGCCDDYECGACGETFRVECPD